MVNRSPLCPENWASPKVYKWKRTVLDHGANGLAGTELKENTALKKRVKELEMENEILKKAALIFGRGALKTIFVH